MYSCFNKYCQIFMNWDHLSKKVLIKTHMPKLIAFMTSLFQGYVFYNIECIWFLIWQQKQSYSSPHMTMLSFEQMILL